MAVLNDLVVSGASSLVGPVKANTIQLDSLKIPTTSNGTTYGTGTAGQILKTNGTTVYWDNQVSTYSLPLAANGTRGGVQIGYSENGKNYAVKLSGEKMYVTVPWTDTTAATTIAVTNTTPTSATTYYPLYATGNSGQQTVRANADLYYYDTGTSSYFNVGSSSNLGGITLHQTNGYYATIIPASLTANRDHYLPNVGGTLLNTGNYNSYAPKLDGTGATGTWGINISGNAATATLLALHNGVTSTTTRSTHASTWQGEISGAKYMWGQAFKDTSIGTDTGDIVLAVRPGVYTSGGTELCVCIDGDYYSMGNKVLHAGNYTSYAVSKYGGIIANRGTGGVYNDSALEIREYNYSGAGSDTWGQAPRLSFHWGNRNTAQIGLASNGHLYTAPAGGSTFYKLVYESGTWGINISGNAATATKATQDGAGNVITSKYVTLDTTQTISGAKTFSSTVKMANGYEVHSSAGTKGTAGHVKIATLKISGSYQNAPISFKFIRRMDQLPTDMAIQFNNLDGVDPTLGGFGGYGAAVTAAYLHKSATSTWDLYITKAEAYDTIHIIDFNNSYNKNITVTWVSGTQVSTLPASGTTGTWYGNIHHSVTASAFNSARSITLTGGVTGSASSNGASGWSIATTVASVAWGNITGKPSTFAPSSHSHAWGDITGKPSTFTPSSHSHAWGDITGKPSTFTPSAHSHSYIPYNGQSNYNCNTAYDAGIYMISNGSNCPSGSQYGSLFTIPYRQGTGNSAPDFGTQIFIPNGDDSVSPNSMFFRTALRDSWNAWKEVSVVGHTHSYLPLSGGTITGNITFASKTSTTSPVEQRIVINGVSNDSTIANAPGIGFHIPNITWGSLKFCSDSSFRFYDNSCSAYMPIYASKVNVEAPSGSVMVGVTNNAIGKINLQVSDNGDRGIYNSTAGKWLIYSGSDNITKVPANQTVSTAAVRNIKIIAPGTAVTPGTTAISTGEVWMRYEN